MSHVRRIVNVRVLVVARSGPVRSAILGAFAFDRGMLVIGDGAGSHESALADAARWRPAVVVIDETTIAASGVLAAVLASREAAPAIVLVGRERAAEGSRSMVVQARDGSDDELLDFQGEIVGAVWSAAASRLKNRTAAGSR